MDLFTQEVTAVSAYLPDEHRSWSDALFSFFKLFIAISCLIANLFAIVVILYGKLYQKNMYFLLLLTALVDAFLGLVHLPFTYIISEVLKEEAENSSLCFLYAASTIVFVDTSLLCLTTFNVDRWIAIRWPYFYVAQVDKKRLVMTFSLLIIAIWIVKGSMLVTAPVVKYNEVYQVCAAGSGTGARFPVRYIPTMIIALVSNLVILIASYQVSLVVKQHERSILEHDIVFRGGSGALDFDKKILSSFKSVVYTTMVHCVFTLPKIVLLFVPRDLLPGQVPAVMIWLMYTIHTVNIIIHGYNMDGFRTSFLRLSRCGRMKRQVAPEVNTMATVGQTTAHVDHVIHPSATCAADAVTRVTCTCTGMRKLNASAADAGVASLVHANPSKVHPTNYHDVMDVASDHGRYSKCYVVELRVLRNADGYDHDNGHIQELSV